MPNLYFLRIGDDSLEEAIPFQSRQGAIRRYSIVARELASYGQEIEASVHVAPSRSLVGEYPDWVLQLGPRGGVQVHQA